MGSPLCWLAVDGWVLAGEADYYSFGVGVAGVVSGEFWAVRGALEGEFALQGCYGGVDDENVAFADVFFVKGKVFSYCFVEVGAVLDCVGFGIGVYCLLCWR